MLDLPKTLVAASNKSDVEKMKVFKSRSKLYS